MHPWVRETIARLTPMADPETASAMQAYMRNQFEFLGIQSVPRRAAMKALLSSAQRPSINELSTVINQLWQLPEREYQMVALDLLIASKKRLPATMLNDLQRWLTTQSWWDTVDLLATHIAGELFTRYPAESAPFLLHWRGSDNIWLRRTTLLFQLKYKSRTDDALLFSLITDNQSDTEFFIQKAIGWALREYSKTNPDAVTHFIKQQNIQCLAKREALKWLSKQTNSDA
ncbi:hypothetical protein VSVS12_01757 [Vibrio scophthalmi]|uniref:DNA alkylation repair protein n=1 Tax=Vibrio scophthalmi TaxID=45658 RepID=UPI0008095F2D|nr:DNA alkylation repair protein [Vibrio scophthalmi]ANS85524.1 hypothetical protein VSVS12_01757 [Vibrio scophthalmi]